MIYAILFYWLVCGWATFLNYPGYKGKIECAICVVMGGIFVPANFLARALR